MVSANIEKILLPIDGSDASLRATDYAVKLAKKEDAKILCIHVISRPAGFSIGSNVVDAFYEEARKPAKKLLERVMDVAKKQSVYVETAVLEAESTIDNIVKYALDRNVDIIIIGTRGRTRTEKILLGSVANGVVNCAHCPVLVVR